MFEYQDIVKDSILPFMADQGVEVIGVFEDLVGGPSNELTLMLAYRDMAHMQDVAEDSTLTTIQRDSFEAIRVLNNKALVPVAFSPMQ